MSLFLISLIVIGAVLVGVKAYFQEKEKQALENQKPESTPEQTTTTPEKNNQEIVADRLAEIASFEKELEESKTKTEASPLVIEEKKPKSKKKYYRPKKQQPKIKAK